jgi:hypothetical protein
MRASTRQPLSVLVAGALCLALSACGGGSDDATTTTPSTPPVVTPPTTPVTAPGAAAQDLTGFAAAWMAYQMLASVHALQLAAGGNGTCGLGGTVAWDAGTGTGKLAQCRMREFPWQVYSGRNTVAQLVANADRSVVSAALSAPSVQVLSAETGALEYTITGGEIAGALQGSDDGDRYTFTASSLRIHVGQSSDYTISNAGSTSTAVVFRNGLPERTTDNLVYTVSNGTTTWQVTVMSPVHEAGDARPDRGHLMIVPLGAAQALNATFGGNSITLDGGATGAARTLAWNDAGLQAALAAGRR